MTFIYILLLFAAYIIIDLLLRKKLKIKPQKGFSRIFKGRNKIFMTIEIVLLISFLIIPFFLPAVFFGFGLGPLSVFIFLFILHVLRGLEEWMFRRQEKEYYHSWLGASLFLFSFIIILVSDF